MRQSLQILATMIIKLPLVGLYLMHRYLINLMKLLNKEVLEDTMLR